MELKGKQRLYNTDNVARNVFLAMLSDFRSFHDHFRPGIEEPFLSDLSVFRERIEDFTCLGSSVGRVKAHHQLIAILKKWKFEHDVFTEEELVSRSYEKYFKEQERISSFTPRSVTSHEVLRTARKICRQTLGHLDKDEMLLSCRFGTNSSIGCSLAHAHIDHKLTCRAAFTSSSKVAKWFDEVTKDDLILRRIIERANPSKGKLRFVAAESLILHDVDKTWKIRRIITPLPLLDLYYSNGFGALVTERLKTVGIDIKRQQTRHQRWVKGMSVRKHRTTADLSSASDSITSHILNAVLPREWYTALKPILCHKLIDNEGIDCYTSSVLPMGNGATFPVETLLFYCLLKAISILTDVNGLISVYGDDLIYPSRLHKYVAVLFPKLGFVLNMEKTFTSSNFRESCGADYFHGCDVRPFYLKGRHQLLTRTRYMAFLYKMVNGLRLRWEYCELPQTFLWLFTQISLCSVDRQVYRVPVDFPATAGIQTSSPFEVPMGLDGLNWSPVIPSFKDGTRLYTFKSMKERARRRYTVSVEPYYWLTLQNLDDSSLQWGTETFLTESSRFSFRAESALQQLKWHKRVQKVKFRKDTKLIERTVVKWSSSVADKKLCDDTENTSSVTDWT